MPPRMPNEDLDDEEIDAGTGVEGEGGDDDEASLDAAEQDGVEGQEGEGEEVDSEELPARQSFDKRSGRGSGRFQRLSNEVQDLRRQLRERGPSTSAQEAPVRAAPRGPQEEPEETFRARIALLAPHEQMLETQQRSERRFSNILHAQSLQQQDMLDKVTFDAKAAANPRYQRYATEVETLRAELAQQGQMVPRQVLLEVVIGRKVLANDGKAKPQRQAAQRRVAAQTTKPAQARSDVAGNRRQVDDRTARAKRLEGLQI